MKNRKALFAVIAFLTGFVLIHASAAQDLGLKELEQKQQADLEIYLDHADQTQTQDQWLRVSRFGVQTIMAQWEIGAAQLADQGVDLPTERDRLEGSLNTLLEQRFARWLIEKAFSEEARAQSAELARTVVQSNLQKLYKTDENGIVYDSSGDPEMYQTANLEGDQADWKDAVSKALSADLGSWNEHAAAIRTELLSALPDGTAFEGQFTATEQQYRSAYQRELDTEFQREESRFLNARLRDQLSLRKKSENKTAASVVSQIIAIANQEMSDGLQTLRDSLSTAHAVTPEGEMVIDPTAWQESFRREFDKGMACWTQAEQDLLLQRAEWEKSVAYQFQNGEQEWSKAYQLLQGARTDWEKEIDGILDKGRTEWESKQSELSAAIAQARLELSRSMDSRAQSLDTTIGNVTTLCNQAANILRTAESSLAYWGNQTDDSAAAAAAVSFWTPIKNTYEGYYTYALQYLADTATRLNGGSSGAISYADILGTDDSDNQYLDDYQVALLGAKATEAYWQKQVDIAKAVAIYAHDSSSLRPTETETEQARENALAVFSSKQKAYEDALAALESCGKGVDERQGEIQQLNAELQSIDNELNSVRQQYQALIDMFDAKDDSPFREQIQGYYKQLCQTTGLEALEDAQGKSEVTAYADYLCAMNGMGLEETVNGAIQAVGHLVLGDSVTDTASLKELSDAADQAKKWSFSGPKGEFLNSLESLGISSTDNKTAAVYTQLSEEFDGYNKADDGSSEKALARLRIVGFANQLVCQKQDELARRLAEIALLTTSSLAEWAGTHNVPIEASADFAAAQESIEKNADRSLLAACLDQAFVQKAILDGIAADPKGVSGTSAFSFIASPSALASEAFSILGQVFVARTGLACEELQTEASLRSAALQKVIDMLERIGDSENPTLTAHSDEVRALARSDDLIRLFLSGTSMFAFGDADYGSLVLTDPPRKAAMSQYLASVLAKDKGVAPALRQGIAKEAVGRLQELLVERKIATEASAGTVTFRNALDVFKDVWKGSANGLETWLQETQQDIAELSADLPRTVVDQTQSIIRSLSQLFALQTLSLDSPASTPSDTTKVMSALAAEMKGLQSDLTLIQSARENSANDPAALLAALHSVQSVMKSGGFESSAAFAVKVTVDDVSARFVAEAAVLVAKAIFAVHGSHMVSNSILQDAVNAYLSSSTIKSMLSEPDVSSLLPGITSNLLASVRSTYERVCALSNPDDADWSALGQAVKDEYASSVWNAYPPEWFAGRNGDSSREPLVTLGTTQLDVLHSMYMALAGSWGATGVSETSWDEFLLDTYYSGSHVSLNFDESLASFEATIGSRVAAGQTYAGISRSFLKSDPLSENVLSGYESAAGLKNAIDDAIGGRFFDEQAAMDAAEGYFAAHSFADTPQMRLFVAKYLDVFRGSAGLVNVNAQRNSWIGLLRDQLGQCTLSKLSATTQFNGVAAVDLVCSVSDALVDAGFTGCDFDLLKDVLVDVQLSDAEELLLGGNDAPACRDALDAFLANLDENQDALTGSDIDRGFEIACRYTRGYLGCDASQVESYRQEFRGRYLSADRDALDVARDYYDVVRTLASADRDPWFSQKTLSAAGQERVSAIAQIDLTGRADTNVNERSFALGINYDLASLNLDEDRRIALTDWMLSVSGVAVPSRIDTLLRTADGKGNPSPTDDALLFLLGSPQAALWILKRKIRDGMKIDEYEKDVDPSTWSEALDFQIEWSRRDGYISGAEADPLQFGAIITGNNSFEDAVAVGACALTGTSDDAIFASRSGASGTEILDDTATLQAARTKVALDYLAGLLSTHLSNMALTAQGLGAVLTFDQQFDQLAKGLDKSPLAYRAYINKSIMNVKDGENLVPADQPIAATVTSSGVSAAVDGKGITCVQSASNGVAPGPIYENALLEALSEFRSQSSRFNEAVDKANSVDLGPENVYYAAVDPIAEQASSKDVSKLLSQWSSVPVSDFDLTGACKATAKSASDTLNALVAQTSAAQREIVDIGCAIALKNATDKAECEAVTKDYLATIDRLTASRDGAKVSYDESLSAFEAANEHYATLYNAAQYASEEMEDARYSLQKAEAIWTFAATGYLNADAAAAMSTEEVSDGADSENLAVDPDQRLAAAKAGHLKAQAALDALRSLYDAKSQPEDFAAGDSPDQIAYANAFKDYQRQYGAYLAMEELSNLLSSGVATQQKKVATAEEALDESIKVLVNPAPTALTAGTEDDPKIQDYIQIAKNDGSTDLPEFNIGPRTTDGGSTLNAYLTGKGNLSFEADREVWVKMLSDYVSVHGTGFLTDWSLAFQKQMADLNLDSLPQDSKFKALFANYYANASSTELVDQGADASTLNKYGIAAFDASSQLRNDAYGRVMNDTDQKQLYEFFIVMNMLGLIGKESITITTIKAQYLSSARTYLDEQLKPVEDQLHGSAESKKLAGFVLHVIALPFLNPFTFPAYIMYEASAVLLILMAESDNVDAQNIETYRQLLLGSQTGNTGLANEINGDTTQLSEAIRAYQSSTGTKKKEQEKLDAMLGAASGKTVGVSDVVNAITTAASTQKQIDMDDVLSLANAGITDPSERLDLSGLISRYIDAATGATDAATAINDMFYACETKRDNALKQVGQVAATLEDAQGKSMEAYRTALANVQAMDVDAAEPSSAYLQAVQDLENTARMAYLNPTYRAKDHLNRMLNLARNLQTLVDPVTHPELSQAQQDLLNAQQSELAELQNDRMDQYMAVQEQQWAQMQQELSNQINQWQASTNAIMKRANVQWDSAFQQLEQQYEEWKNCFTSVYQNSAEIWDAKYVKLESGKADWVRQAAGKAALIGSEAVLSQLGQSAEASIKDATTLLVGNLGIAAPDASGTVAHVLSGMDFASLIKSGNVLNRGIAGARTTVFARLEPEAFDSARVLRKVQDMGNLNTEQIDKQVLLITAHEANKAVAKATKQMNDQVGEANQSVADSLNWTLVEAGFVRSGDHYERETVVDSTVGGPVTELHIVPCYAPYVPETPIASTVDLSDAKLLQLSAQGIQAQVDLAIKQMSGQVKEIFGEQDSKGSATVKSWTNMNHSYEMTISEYVKDGRYSGHYEYQTITVDRYTLDEGEKAAEIGGGKFGEHVGASPEMAEKPDPTAGPTEHNKYLAAEGSNQMAAVITPFLWSQLKQGMGWAQVSRPIYDQKLWDDRNSWVKAPTMRSVADVGVSVVAAIATGGAASPLIAALETAGLTLAEKTVFTVADVANGQMTAEQGWTQFGKNVLGSALSVGMGELGSTVNTSLNTMQGFGGVVAKTMWSGAQEMMTNLGQGLINGINYTYDASGVGHLSMDSNVIAESLVGKQAVAGLLGGMGNTAASGLLGGNLTGFSALDKASVMSVSNVAGATVNAGIQYGLTGEATLNVLNFADVSGNQGWNAGLVEMQLGGQDGFSMNLGSGGVNLNVGMIGQAVAGMGTFVKQQQIRWYEATEGVAYSQSYGGSREVGTLLRENYSFGGEKARTQLDRLLGGQDRLQVGYIANEGQTVTVGDSRIVNLATLGDSGDISSQLAAGIVLGHEAYRNGIDDGAAGQATETAAAVLGHTEMALRVASEYRTDFITGNANLMNDVIAYSHGAAAFADYVGANYDSSSDYWRLKATRNDKGEATGYTVAWDDSLDLTMENANGTTMGIAANQIGQQEGLNSIQQWFAANGLGSTWNANLSTGFGKLGNVSTSAQTLMTSIQNSGAEFNAARSNFLSSVDSLMESGLALSALGSVPDQGDHYSLMPGDMWRTTLYGSRLLTPALAAGGVTGQIYSWAANRHLAEDFAGSACVLQTPTESTALLRWTADKGLGVMLSFGDGNSLTSNHLGSSSVMDLLDAMLISGSSTNLLAGLQFAHEGMTGSAAGTGVHNHLEANYGAVVPSVLMAQMSIPQVYADSMTLLTGFPADTPYNDPTLLAQIVSYSRAYPAFDKQAYVNAHADLFQPYSRLNGRWREDYTFDSSVMKYQMRVTDLFER